MYELNGGFTKEALEKLIDYAYTARLDFHQLFSSICMTEEGLINAHHLPQLIDSTSV